MPLTSITDWNIDAESLFSKEMRLVNERLNSTDDLDTMVAIVEGFLLGQLKKTKIAFSPIDIVAKHLLSQPNGFRLDYLADQSCLSVGSSKESFLSMLGCRLSYLQELVVFIKLFA
jgi:hypothetical protein